MVHKDHSHHLNLILQTSNLTKKAWRFVFVTEPETDLARPFFIQAWGQCIPERHTQRGHNNVHKDYNG